MRVHLEMLGCRLNEAEIETWSRDFRQLGDELVPSAADADVVIFNTCAVTAEAGRKSRNWLKRVQKYHPQTQLVATGCYATLAPEKLADTLGVDLVIPNAHKDNLVHQVRAKLNPLQMPQRAQDPDAVPLFLRGRTRAFIKVQDGCRNRCSFCIVTVVRGEEKSRTLEAIVQEINALVDEGVQEAVLTGVHVGGYGADLGLTLSDLIRGILTQTRLPRLRLASVEPWDLPDDFFTLWDNPRLMPHIHLPLQSGCDTVLKRMSRRCSTERYRALVQQAKAVVPDMNITTDIIVGFPGETEDEWKTSFEFAREMQFQHIHIFSYSPREGTKAARLPSRVLGPVQKDRNQQLHRLGKIMKRAAMSEYVGTQAEVLFEHALLLNEQTIQYSGYTPNYMRVQVEVPSQVQLENQRVPVGLIGLNTDQQTLKGEISSETQALFMTPNVQRAVSKSTLLHVVDPH